jgi:hypothetical protein
VVGGANIKVVEDTTLQNHIVSAHLDYTKLTNNKTQNQLLISEHLYPVHVQNYWGWLDWVIGDLMQFEFVENGSDLRNCTKITGISVDSFMRKIDLLTTAVKNKIKDMLPDKFFHNFNGWMLDQTHFSAIIATFYESKTALIFSLDRQRYIEC